MTQHQRAQREGLECGECNGRSFTDATKEFHWPECSKYRAWRFGDRSERRDAGVAVRSDKPLVVARTCPHGFEDWTYCPTCTAAADFDGGGE